MPRSTFVSLVLLLTLVSGLALATVRFPAYTTDQLQDPAFVKSELAKYRAQSASMEKQLQQASSLVRASLDRDARNLEIIIEMLDYVDRNGFHKSDPGLSNLTFFKHRSIENLSELPSESVELTRKPDLPPVVGHGSVITPGRYLLPDLTTVFLFFSKKCPYCPPYEEKLKKLHQRRPDVMVIMVDIDRSGSKGIDFKSPVAEQFDIGGVPTVKVFPPGKPALDWIASRDCVSRWLQDAGLR